MGRYPAQITQMFARLEESRTVLAPTVAARTGAGPGTRTDGSFQIPAPAMGAYTLIAMANLPEGDYTVIASGYPPAASRLRVTSGNPHTHDVELGHPEA